MNSELNDMKNLLGDDFESVFKELIDEICGCIESLDQKFSQNPHWNQETLNMTLAKLHTMKGLTAQFGLMKVSKIIHHVEDMMAIFKKGTTLPPDNIIPALMKFNDAFRVYIEALENQDESHDNLIQNLEKLSDLSSATKINSRSSGEVVISKELKTYSLDQEQFNLIFDKLQGLLEKTREGNDPCLIKDLETSLFAISSARFIKISPVIKRIEAMVTDIAGKVGKEIEFAVEGQQVLIDRMIYTTLGEILVHILKNSIDHGIEDEKTRIENGKPAMGNLKVTFESHDDKTRIIISDDGKGLDPDSIGRKAFEKGVVTKEQLARMTSYEKQFLIFEAGFSTKDEVSELSGRGVGMDAVLKEVKKNAGSILLDSTPGQGTKLIIDYPCAFQMRSCVIWRLGSTSFALPASSVQKVILRNDQYSEEAGLIKFHEEEIPLLELKLGKLSTTENHIIICQVGGMSFGLKADEVVGCDQLFLRPITYQKDERQIITAIGEIGRNKPVYYVNVAELETNLNQYMSAEEHQPAEDEMNNILPLESFTKGELTKEQIIAHITQNEFMETLKEIIAPTKTNPELMKEAIAYISGHLDSLEQTVSEVDNTEELQYSMAMKYAYLKSEWILFNIRIQYLSMAEKELEEILPYKAALCSNMLAHFEKVINKDAISQITKVLAEPFSQSA